jgi:hypothetical protein
MKDSSLIAFSFRPAGFTQRVPLGSPGSRALSFQACPGSSTAQGDGRLALNDSHHFAFRIA